MSIQASMLARALSRYEHGEEDAIMYEIPRWKGMVVRAIESEREYQEKKWPGHQHTTAEWLLIMQKCLDDAKKAWACGHGDNQALHEIRQVVATGVACMEQCGAPSRGDQFSEPKYGAKRVAHPPIESFGIESGTVESGGCAWQMGCGRTCDATPKWIWTICGERKNLCAEHATAVSKTVGSFSEISDGDWKG